MSHWVYAPRVARRDGEVLLDLTDSHWDLIHSSETDGRIQLRLRRYPGDGNEVVVSVDAATGEIRLRDERVHASKLEAALDAHTGTGGPTPR